MDPTRQDRSLGEVLGKTIRDRFRASAGQTEIAPEALYAYGVEELAALRALMGNAAKNKHKAHVPYKMASKDDKKQARIHSAVQLSTSTQKESQGFVARVKRSVGIR